MTLLPTPTNRSQNQVSISYLSKQVRLQRPLCPTEAGSHGTFFSAAAGFAQQGFAHEHFQKRLVANALAFSDLAGLCKIGFRQPDSDLHAALLVQLRNQTRSPGPGSFRYPF